MSTVLAQLGHIGHLLVSIAARPSFGRFHKMCISMCRPTRLVLWSVSDVPAGKGNTEQHVANARAPYCECSVVLREIHTTRG